ncbi:MAG: hypothetical protein ACTHMJ_20675 [Thermomicrobiales bacterium]
MFAAQLGIGWLLALLVVLALNGAVIWRLRRFEQARVLHLAERRRVLTRYARMRDGRCYHPRRFPESVYQPDATADRRR